MTLLEKFQAGMEKYFVPLAAKINGQRHVASVRDAFTLAFPLTLAGSLIVLINYAILDPNGFIAKLLHLGDLIPNLASYQAIFAPVLNGSNNIMSLLIVVLVAYKLAEIKKGDKILSAITALSVFFVIYPPYISSESGMGGVRTDFLGAQGLFVAIAIGLLVGEFLPILAKNEKLKIKMPAMVPPAVAQSFNALIPIIMVTVVGALLNYIFNTIVPGGIHVLIYNTLQAPFSGLGDSILTVILFATVQNFFWVLGIHGPNTLNAVRTLIYAELDMANLTYFNEFGTTVGTPYPVTWGAMNDCFANIGGSGATLGLIIAIFLVARKDKAQTEIAKLSIAPGLFNINETIIFGLPIVMNPIYIVPFVLTPVVLNIYAYLLVVVFEIIPPATMNVGWTTPGFLFPFLASGGTNILSLVAGFGGVAISTLMYLPFAKVAASANLRKSESNE